MAKQQNMIPLVGTVGNLVLYKSEGKYYGRKKSSLSSKRVKTSESFKNTMKWANLLGKASTIASKIYRQQPEKNFASFRILTGMAMTHLKAGLTEEEVLSRLGYQK